MARGPGAGEQGFTLIEMMMVVAIVAILIGIAIPTVLSTRPRAQDSVAESEARQALKAERILFTDKQAFSDNPADAHSVEPAFAYTNSPPPAAGSNQVYLKAYGTPATTLVVGTRSASGICFWMRDRPTGPGTEYLANDCRATPDDASPMGPSW